MRKILRKIKKLNVIRVLQGTVVAVLGLSFLTGSADAATNASMQSKANAAFRKPTKRLVLQAAPSSSADSSQQNFYHSSHVSHGSHVSHSSHVSHRSHVSGL